MQPTWRSGYVAFLPILPYSYSCYNPHSNHLFSLLSSLFSLSPYTYIYTYTYTYIYIYIYSYSYSYSYIYIYIYISTNYIYDVGSGWISEGLQ